MAAVAQVVGGGLKAFGYLAQGRAAREAGDYNAGLDQANATAARAETAADVDLMRRDQERQLGAIRAAAGASGVTQGGSVTELSADTAAQTQLDILRRKYAGELKAMGFENDAGYQKFKGKTAQRLSYVEAAGSLLGSFGGGSSASSTALFG